MALIYLSWDSDGICKMIVAVQASFRCRLRAFCKHFGGRVGQRADLTPTVHQTPPKFTTRVSPKVQLRVPFETADANHLL
ncbi:hypothetical protein P152DRAFT_453967 [Eremomyces bilateralis CBS 781.70]|uniref:Uncharacterized protein n=1 Tax=Eremomyces bilateralis CBS 781.70 TaxID=1392243 RepID=A0A6G1GHA0_9PEZI|nr:uncharacterized protein P152DRAFT_453967 [Eremomyces bilateralis CBS 781.70]KAF1817384.1 hypothetical protein P152DRAFT_453967 [Eremomyces bilateralis CBS 781.70]